MTKRSIKASFKEISVVIFQNCHEMAMILDNKKTCKLELAGLDFSF
jgi:hypothetical protein